MEWAPGSENDKGRFSVTRHAYAQTNSAVRIFDSEVARDQKVIRFLQPGPLATTRPSSRSIPSKWRAHLPVMETHYNSNQSDLCLQACVALSHERVLLCWDLEDAIGLSHMLWFN